MTLDDLGLLTVQGVAAQVGRSCSAVRQWIALGHLRAVPVPVPGGVVYLIRAKDLAQFAVPKRGRPKASATRHGP